MCIAKEKKSGLLRSPWIINESGYNTIILCYSKLLHAIHLYSFSIFLTLYTSCRTYVYQHGGRHAPLGVYTVRRPFNFDALLLSPHPPAFYFFLRNFVQEFWHGLELGWALQLLQCLLNCQVGQTDVGKGVARWRFFCFCLFLVLWLFQLEEIAWKLELNLTKCVFFEVWVYRWTYHYWEKNHKTFCWLEPFNWMSVYWPCLGHCV